MTKSKIFFIWIAVWVPLSLLLVPTHGHFPLGGPLSPITALFLPFMQSSEQIFSSFNLKYVFYPALGFWSTYTLALIVVHFSNKKSHSRRNTKGFDSHIKLTSKAIILTEATSLFFECRMPIYDQKLRIWISDSKVFNPINNVSIQRI